MSFTTEFIMGRVHVSASNLQVCREIRQRFKPEVRRDRTFREARHKVYREALEIHARHRGLYGHVMGGGHGFTGKQ
jgi:hypothetical protein